MIVIGLHNTGVLSSAALVVDGRLVFAAAEERFSRNKYDKSFPHRAIEASLRHAGLSLSDVDWFAVAWNPAINLGQRYRAGFSEWPAYPGARFYSNPNQLLPRLGPRAFSHTEQIFHQADGRGPVFDYVAHHLAHATNASVLSGFERTAVLSVDGYGERTSCSGPSPAARRSRSCAPPTSPTPWGPSTRRSPLTWGSGPTATNTR